ncbi:MAG TPA: site-2 protease family protein [Gemmataceae bacterium]|nr:site-2 protease family protein [Gemmataceae bacterium]
MRDPFFWSIPLGRLFGITIRVHLLFPVVALAMILRFALSDKFIEGTWIDVAVISLLLFVSVLCHEFGHCFAARWVDGDATEIMIWPLGGLASVDVPHQPRAHFITAAGGPAVNLLFCIVCALLLAFAVHPSFQPPWNPLNCPVRGMPPDFFKNLSGYPHEAIGLSTWGGTMQPVVHWWPLLLARLFWVNWMLFVLNMVLVCFPLDAGRMLQSVLWPHLGYRQATLGVIYAGFVMTVIVGLLSIVYNEILVFCLAAFIYISCRTQLFVLETGGEEGLFGYDFSQGYTSLERDQPTPTTRKTSWWKRWRDRRAARKLQQEMETREADERRLDELLEKVQRLGMGALTDEERRFMKRVSDRYRNRN